MYSSQPNIETTKIDCPLECGQGECFKETTWFSTSYGCNCYSGFLYDASEKTCFLMTTEITTWPTTETTTELSIPRTTEQSTLQTTSSSTTTMTTTPTTARVR